MSVVDDSSVTDQAEPSAPEPADPLIGAVLKQAYKVSSVLGVGGMGTVYKATQLAIGREVAVKVLKKDFGDAELTQQAMARFQREARITSQLTHPNTVRVIDFGETDDRRMYLVLELLHGEPLDAVLKRKGVLHPTRVARIGKQVAESLAEAHALGVVHRDIKPDNIFMSRGTGHHDFAKVMDFGIAGTQDAAKKADRLTSEHSVVGSVHYMSPEQAEGVDLDARSDIYSLGIMLYELIAGTPPFDHESVLKIMVMHASSPVPVLPLPEVMPEHIADAWRALVEAMLAKEVKNRVPSTQVVIDELEWIIEQSAAAQFDTSKRPTINSISPADWQNAETRARLLAAKKKTPLPGSVATAEPPASFPAAPELERLDTEPDLTTPKAGEISSEMALSAPRSSKRWAVMALVAALVAAIALIAIPGDEPATAPAGAAKPVAESPQATTASPAAAVTAKPAAAPSETVPATAAPVVEKATVRFDVQPAKAAVLSGSTMWCETPCTYRVEPGKPLKVTLQLPGFASMDVELPGLQPGQRFDVKRTLTELKAPTPEAPVVESAKPAAAEAKPAADTTAKKKTKKKKRKKRRKLPGFRR